MDIVTISVLMWMLLPFPLIVVWVWERKRSKGLTGEIQKQAAELSESEATVKGLQEKLAPITSIEAEAGNLRRDADKLCKDVERVRSDYGEKRQLLEALKQQVAIYDDRLSFAELGVYEPHFEFNDSDEYKDRIKLVREAQKRMVSSKSATLCPTDWTVDGSRSKGQTMINRQSRLTLRAFNNECEAAIANTRWNNVVAMEKRVLNAAKQIDSANSSMKLAINEEYIALKIDELHLTHEYREKLKLEKDERADLARAAREEKKLLKEAEAAEREEQKYQTLLDQARREAGVDEERILELEAALSNAHAVSERARAMAEMTKSGYVYVISNIGSFGEDVVKIGLTRRLEPDERVKELGDASVPFGFDTHAMIYSEEAPALEAALHREFAERRVNQVNSRKEFFRVGLGEVKEAVVRLAPDASFFTDREAQEWHETLAKRKVLLANIQAEADELPFEI